MVDLEQLGVPKKKLPKQSYAKASKKKTGFPLRTVIIVIAVIVILGLLAGGGYWYHKNHKTTKQTSSQSSLSVASTNSSSSSTNYISNGNDLNLSFSYPSNWTVTPPSNDNTSDQTITVTSPLLSITNSAGTKVTGVIVVLVRSGTSTISELNSNSPTAAVASTQIAFSNPTSAQYQYPYLSFIHFTDGSSASGDFEEVMITADQSFTPGEMMGAENISGVDPYISASFYQCLTQSCSGSNQKPLSISITTWQNSNTFKQVLTLLESFKLN